MARRFLPGSAAFAVPRATPGRSVSVVIESPSIDSLHGKRGRPQPTGPVAGEFKPRLPALETELLGLLLDVVVVLSGALLGGGDAGADGDRDLLQCRSLDRGEELEGRRRLALVEVRLHVRDHGR